MIYADRVTGHVPKHVLPGFDTETVLTEEGGFTPEMVQKMSSKFIILNSVSKTWSATGWRCGWVICPESITPGLRAVHDQMVLQVATPIQIGCEALLQVNASYYESMRLKYQERRDFFVPALEELGFEMTYPNAAYYVLVRYEKVPALAKLGTAMEACMLILTECKVACVAGENFFDSKNADVNDPTYLRFCFCRQMPDLQEAVKRLQKLKDL